MLNTPPSKGKGGLDTVEESEAAESSEQPTSGGKRARPAEQVSPDGPTRRLRSRKPDGKVHSAEAFACGCSAGSSCKHTSQHQTSWSTEKELQ